jgi:hypothetical protein
MSPAPASRIGREALFAGGHSEALFAGSHSEALFAGSHSEALFAEESLYPLSTLCRAAKDSSPLAFPAACGGGGALGGAAQNDIRRGLP